MRKALLPLIAAISLSGCATYQVAEIDASQQAFPSRIVVQPQDIAVNKPYEDLSRAGFVVVRAITNREQDRYREFIERSVAQLGLPDLIGPDDYARMIEERNITDATATFDVVNLQRVYRHVGPFLVMDFILSVRGDHLTHRVLVYDPESNDVLLDARKSGVVWLSLDQEFNYPVLNLVRDWVLRSGGLGADVDSTYVSGPVERTVNGWHVDSLNRTRHLASGVQVPGRVVGLRPVQPTAFDGDRLNVSVEFQQEDPPFWMSLFVYPRFHGMPEPDDELRLSIHNSLEGRDGELKSAARGDVAVEGVRRPAWAASMQLEDDGHQLFNWTVIVPTRAWYLKVLATELVVEGVEPGEMSLRNAGRLLSALGLPEGAFDEAPDAADEGGFRALDDVCERIHCHPPRTVRWTQNDGTATSRRFGVPQPVVDDGLVTLYVGDRVHLEFADEDGLGEPTAVPRVRDPARTVTLEFEQEEGRPDTLLTVTNPFGRPLKYRMSTRPVGFQDSYPLVSCPVQPGDAATEAWPHALPRVTLNEFRLLGPDDETACAH